MTNKRFNARHGISVGSNNIDTIDANGNIVANTILVGGASLNSTSFAGTANNASNFNGQPAAFYTNASNLSTGTVNVMRLPTSGVTANVYGSTSQIPVITVDQYGRVTTVTTSAVAGVVSFTYTAANSTFAIAAGDASVYTATISPANSSVAGIVTVLDTVANTSSLIAASVNSVKTAYDAAISANTRAASAQTAAISAYSNAISYVDVAVSNAVSVAASDATAKAGNAYSNAVTYAANVSTAAYSNAVSVAASDATTKANNAYTTAVSAAASDATSKANNAYTTAVAAASSDATTKANNAYTTAVSAAASDATTKANNAYTTAVAAAASDATTKADNTFANAVSNATSFASSAAATAYTNAISVASSDATNKAANAYSNAISIAASDATTKANNAYTTAVAAAASDATTKANNAYTQAISVASSDASSKASTAYTNAVGFAGNASNISSGTLAEARLPHRMNQNVRTTDGVTFANGSITGNLSVGGNLIVTGNLESTNVQSLAVSDPLIKLGVNNPADTSWGGFTFHYSGSGNTTNHAGLVRNPTTKEFLLMSTFGDETAVANNNTINVADPSFSYANLQVNMLTAQTANVGGATINSTSFSGTANNASNLGTFAASAYPRKSEAAAIDGAWNFSSGSILWSSHSFTNTYDGSNVYQHIGTATGTDKIWNLRVYKADNNYTTFVFNSAGVATADNSFRAPIFYDLDNTAYYADLNNSNTSIIAAGKVGIGTTSPATNLDVNTTTDAAAVTVRATSSTSSLGGLGIGLFSAGVPAVRGTGNGLDLGASDTARVAFFTSNTERMRLDSSGNLGIGTAQPRGDLSVGTPSTANNTTKSIHLGTTFADFYGFRLTNVNSPGSFAAGTFSIQRGTTAAWVDAVLVNDSGNVGIGTTSPLARLVVSNGSNEGIEFTAGNATLNGGVLQYINRGTSTTRPDMNYYLATGGGSHKFYTADVERMRINDTGQVTITTASGAPSLHLFNSATSNPYLQFGNGNYIMGISDGTMRLYTTSSTHAMTFGTNGADRMRITGPGLVGIGTSFPETTFEVALSTTGLPGLRASRSGAQFQYIQMDIGGGASARLFATGSNKAMFITNNNTNAGLGTATDSTYIQVPGPTANTPITAMYLQSNTGNVGIGTTSPAHPLDVNGIIRTNASVIGTFFADANDSNFFVDPAATSVLNTVRGNSFFTPGGGVGRGLNPGGGQRGNNGASETGALKITLPQSWTSTMLRFTVKVYDYNTNTSFDVSCGGYNWGGASWINTFGYIVANPNVDRNYTIRFGHDGSRACVFIGELNSVWSYVQVAITDVQVGFSSITAAEWEDDWAISIVTSFPTLTGTTISNAQVGRLANIFYDSDNTSYYLDPASSSVLGSVSMFSTSDYQLTLNGNGTSWAGILFADVSNSDTMYYNGSTSTFSIGGGGSAVSGKKLHINGGATIGSSLAATAAPSQGLLVEGSIGATSFYDSANSSFFIDPASGSVLNTLTTRGTIQINEGVSSGSNTAGLAVLRTSFAGGGQYRHSLVTRHNAGANTDNSWDFYVWRPEVAIGAEATHRAFIIDGGTGTTSTIASRAPSFIDLDNTAFFVNPAGTSEFSTIQARGGNGIRSFIDGSSSLVSSIYFANAGNTRAWNWQLDENNDAALWNFDGSAWVKEITIGANRTIEQGNNYAHPEIEWSSTSATGMVIFYLPGTVSNYGMVHMVFDLYEYETGKTSTVTLGGHNWINAWYNNGCQVVGWTDKTVRLGVKNGRFCVVFGGVGSTWNYGTIRLRKIHNGSFYDNIINLAGNWSTEFTNTESFTAVTGDLRQLRTSNSFIADVDIRTPIYYDNNDTNYFVDAASTSRLNQARFQNRISIGDGNGTPSLNTGSPGVWLSYNGGSDIFMGAETSTSAGYWMSGVWRFLINSSGTATASGDFRAPIFYDSQNTAYYFDGAGTSQLNTVNVFGVMNMIGGTAQFWSSASGAYQRVDARNEGSAGRLHWYGVLTNGATSNFRHSYFDGSAYFDLTADAGQLLIARGGGAIVTSNGSFRAPIFFDSDNTGYYVDPNSITSLRTAGSWRSDSSSWDGEFNGKIQYHDNSWYLQAAGRWEFRRSDAANAFIVTQAGECTARGDFRAPLFYDSNNTGYYFDGASLTRANQIYADNISVGQSINTTWRIITNGTTAIYLNGGGYGQAEGSWRAPIFYDSDNTGYFINPNGSSSVNIINLDNGGAIMYNDRGRDVSTVTLPNWLNRSVRWDFVTAASAGTGGNYAGVMTFVPWDGTTPSTGDASYQLVFGGTAANSSGVPQLRIRKGIDTTWNSFFNIHHDGYADMFATSSFRAPIFYDSNNTAFYFDGASTTNINELSGNGKNIFVTTDSYLRINQSSSFPSGCWFGGTLIKGDGYYAGSNGGTTDSRVAILSGGYNGVNQITVNGNDGNITVRGVYARYAHNVGFLQGGYNNIGASEGQSSPIYCIGSSYVPSTTSLSNMYGIGFTSGGSFMPSGASGWGLYIAANGGARVFLDGDGGNITATGNITAYASDRRLKTNITPITNALDKLMRIRGVEFDWINNIEELGFTPQMMHETGVIAQEIQAVIPDAVRTAPFNNDSTRIQGIDHNYLTVDKEKIVPLLIEAIKEQQLTIAQQSAKINTLEHTLERILQKLEG